MELMSCQFIGYVRNLLHLLCAFYLGGARLEIGEENAYADKNRNPYGTDCPDFGSQWMPYSVAARPTLAKSEHPATAT